MTAKLGETKPTLATQECLLELFQKVRAASYAGQLLATALGFFFSLGKGVSFYAVFVSVHCYAIFVFNICLEHFEEEKVYQENREIVSAKTKFGEKKTK